MLTWDAIRDRLETHLSQAVTGGVSAVPCACAQKRAPLRFSKSAIVAARQQGFKRSPGSIAASLPGSLSFPNIREASRALRPRAALIAASIAASGCATLNPDNRSLIGSGDVRPVITEHSFGLQCLGRLIDESKASPLIVHVDDIRDRTIPARLTRESRLSQRSEWLFHTAISKLETDRVRSSLSVSVRDRQRPGRLTISGAWTQDDQLVLQRLGGLDASIGRVGFGLGATRQHDFIAGDFTSSVNDIVALSTAVGVILGSKFVEAALRVEDGADFAEVGFEQRWADGPQLAQRRVAEAATLVHIAKHYKIDYRPCLESGWGNPGGYRERLEDYAAMSQRARHIAIQDKLTALGHSPGGGDGVWGERSRKALMTYQAAETLPVTGEPSAVMYALVSGKAERLASSRKVTNKGIR